MIFRMHRREVPFTVVHNDILNDERISFKAKGLLVYLLSKPDDWRVRSGQLAGVGPDGRAAVRSGLKELEAAGYARFTHIRADDGLLEGTQWEIYDKPFPTDILPDEPSTVHKPNGGARNTECGESTLSENGPLLSTESDQVLRGEDILLAWNAMAPAASLSLVRKITAPRLRTLKTRWRDRDWRDNWQAALGRIPKVPYLCTDEGGTWVADFDWFLKPNSVNAILEGKYDGARRSAPASHPAGSTPSPRHFERSAEADDTFRQLEEADRRRATESEGGQGDA